MKFTEEQFKKLVEIKEEQYQSDLFSVMTENENLYYFIVENNLENEAVALLNPLTREWARERYVDKEKRYVWHSKKNNKYGKPSRLFKDLAQTVRSISVNFTDEVTLDEHLTESEIREWGYDPERFIKEEVE